MTLQEALTARAHAHARLDAAIAALARARETAAECRGEADRLASEEARWIERHSNRLAAWIEGGSHGTRPVAAADAKVVQAQMSARANAAAAAEALTRFEAAETEARAAFNAAEAAVDHEVRAALVAEGDREAEGILADEAALEARRARLRGLRKLAPPTALVRRVAPMEGDWIDTPLNQLSQPRDLDTRLDLLGKVEVDTAYWERRRDELLACDTEARADAA